MNRKLALLLTVLILSLSFLYSQEVDSFLKWEKAVINIEGATDTTSFMEEQKIFERFYHQFEKGEITENEFLNKTRISKKNLRYRGTCVFLKDNNKRYLLTARHVLFDETKATDDYNDKINEIRSETDFDKRSWLSSILEYDSNEIFQTLFRIPTIEELKQYGCPREFLMNLGTGPDYMHPYTFSSPEFDLAVISLDLRAQTKRFADELEMRGYIPISMNDIQFVAPHVGSDVFTVGFPAATSVVAQLILTQAEVNWQSPIISSPIFSFGRTSSFSEFLNYFWCDMSIYPGNSGGPIINNNKLVGIVSAQPIIDIETKTGEKVNPLVTRIPFAKVIKIGYIKDLLDIQNNKDKFSNN